jgi:hypothetical protein
MSTQPASSCTRSQPRTAAQNRAEMSASGQSTTMLLKDKPSLVYDFFGRAWAESFCGPEAVGRLGTRLDAGQVGELRDQMRRFYTAMFDVTDSGMIGLRQADAPRLAVRDRFVLPDVLVARPSARGRMAFPGAGAESPGLSNASQGDTGVVGAWYQQAHATRYGRARLPATSIVQVADDPGPQPQGEDGSRLPFARACASGWRPR